MLARCSGALHWRTSKATSNNSGATSSIERREQVSDGMAGARISCCWRRWEMDLPKLGQSWAKFGRSLGKRLAACRDGSTMFLSSVPTVFGALSWNAFGQLPHKSTPSFVLYANSPYRSDFGRQQRSSQLQRLQHSLMILSVSQDEAQCLLSRQRHKSCP